MIDIEIVREASPIEDVASQYTKLSKVGNCLVGLCFLHSENNPSFTVYAETQSWYCFGCHRGGDVFDFVMAKEHVSFLEALRLLAVRADIPVPQVPTEQTNEIEGRRSIEDALTVATEYYHRCLLKDSPLGRRSRDYLLRRGVTLDCATELRLGVAPGSGLLSFLRGKGIDDELGGKAGLIREQNGKLGDFLRGRIIFPCLKNGRVTWLIGRTIGAARPKYLGLPIPKPLYMSTLRRGVPNTIIVEGPLDAIALWQWEYSVIALMGTASKNETCQELSKIDQPYLCLDSGGEGQKAAITLAERLFPRANLVSLPSGIDDPCDFVEKGHTRDEFEVLLRGAQDYVEHQISEIAPDTDRLKLADILRPTLDSLAELDPAKAEAYLRHRVAPRFGLKAWELAAYRSTTNQLRKELRKKAKPGENNIHGEVDGAVEVGHENDQRKADPAISEKARELLQSPALLYLAGKMIQRLGVAGEGANIRLLYVVVTSRILANPISVTLKSESASGKSYVVEKVLLVFPLSAYLSITGMSRQALVYREEPFSHRTIVIFERPGMEAADYNIRTLQSEGKLVFEVVERNAATNRWETRRVEKEGPTNFIFTTTSPELFPQNETRHWSLLMDESPKQTLAAKLESAKRYLGESGVGEGELLVWQEVQTELKPLRVLIPYAPWLAEHTPDRPLRMRRDFPRLLALIEVIALLHQKQRHVREDGILEAGLSDYFMGRELADQVFLASMSRINKKVKALVEEIERIYKDKQNKGDADPVVKPSEVASALDVDASSVSRWVRPAVEVGLVEVVSETGKGYIRSVRPGNVARRVARALPTVEELAEAFPELAKGFMAVHPLTGEEFTLKEEVAACEKRS